MQQAMIKLSAICSLVMLTAFLALPVFSQDMSGNTYRKKSQTKESTAVAKDININVGQDVVVRTSGEASIVVSGTISNNILTESANMKGSLMPPPVSEAAIREHSFSGTRGVLGVNQSPGNFNNQGNAVSFTMGHEGESGLLMSETSAAQSISCNVLDAKGVTRSNMIKDNAFGSFTGIAGVNQSAGHMNNQVNVMSLSVGGKPVAALSDSSLGMINANNRVIEAGVVKIDMISGNAFAGASGIISVNQSSGVMNNQMNAITISVNNRSILSGIR